jgi:nucleoside-diphosphate-sugar epimerase
MPENARENSRPLRVAVTGANGFVGRELTRQLLAKGYTVIGLVRNRVVLPEFDGMPYTQLEVGENAVVADWEKVLQHVDVIFHLAARVHKMKDDSPDVLAVYRKENVALTATITNAAVASGVRRLIFLSSIKVNGESTDDVPFRVDDRPNPRDAYAISKYEAEQVLLNTASMGRMESVIFRPPLIYGPGVKANFLRMLKWVDKGVPLPLVWVRNRRSMIYLGNLVNALVVSASHPSVINKTYLISDIEDLSTPDIIRTIATALGRKARMWPMPGYLLRLLAYMVGKKEEVERLLGSLQIDSSEFCKDTGWKPPYTFAQGIGATVEWYRGALK